MELNHDCARDLLLSIEKHTNLNEHLMHDEVINLPELIDYNRDTIIYTAQKLQEAGFINGNFDSYFDGVVYISISSLTYNGHVFLDTVRDNVVWKETKKAASNFSSVSLPILLDIGAAYLKNKLSLP
ncbi:hypothetical protein JNUCC1_01611 [Lentibacillus sp. JNUCC-1]|uniref:DUF2513 domain-containing protein n=1 Tax=Lentibacillus sp. JNUCC-1 TaxID=2654513 RepID=UPI0012E8A753|nr:DUF2513 domain-containing protein [Lentibacillus sp. JNUCC-1]MUV37805.1 hypothetical protein [Lentibacillus sp. JNUCC-1]